MHVICKCDVDVHVSPCFTRCYCFFFFPASTVVCSARVFFVFFLPTPPPISDRHTACCGRSIAIRVPREFSRQKSRGPARIMPSALKAVHVYQIRNVREFVWCYFFFIRKRVSENDSVGTRTLVVRCALAKPITTIPTDDRCKSKVLIQNGNESGTTPGSRFG